MYIALLSLEEGINKLDINKEIIEDDLNKNYVVVAEAITNKLKFLNIEHSYEKIKNITRNYNNTEDLKIQIKDFINSLDIDEKIKEELINLEAKDYIGIKSKCL